MDMWTEIKDGREALSGYLAELVRCQARLRA